MVIWKLLQFMIQLLLLSQKLAADENSHIENSPRAPAFPSERMRGLPNEFFFFFFEMSQNRLTEKWVLIWYDI